MPNWGPNKLIRSGLRSSYFKTDQVFVFKGPDADALDPIVSILFDGSFNYSLIHQNRERGKICQNSLHDNTSDVMFMPANLPLNDDLIDIYGFIGESTLQFMSSYHYIDEAKDVDVLDSVTSFKPSLWLMVFFVILLFACLLKPKISRTCPQYLRNFMDKLNNVFAHFIGQNSMDDEGMKVLVITFTFFSLMISQYYNALIHTDLVLPEVPTVPYSYDDFASTVDVVAFPVGTSMLKYFKDSPQDYPEKRLYNELCRRNVTIGIGRPFNMPHWAEGELGENFYRSLYRLRKNHVSIGDQVHLKGLLTTVCWYKVYSEDPNLQEMDTYLKSHFVPRFRKLYPWVSSDPQTRPILHAFIKRKEFIPDKKIWKRVKRSIEQGMFQRMIWIAEASEITEIFSIKVNKRPTEMRDCKEFSRKLKIKEVKFQALKVVNFEKFTLIFLALTSICCMAYIVEVAFKERFTQVHPM